MVCDQIINGDHTLRTDKFAPLIQGNWLCCEAIARNCEATASRYLIGDVGRVSSGQKARNVRTPALVGTAYKIAAYPAQRMR